MKVGDVTVPPFWPSTPQLFNAPVRRCLARAQPIAEDGARVIFCPPYTFDFRPVQGSWRLVEFGADGEALP
jgi:hypothetical protein